MNSVISSRPNFKPVDVLKHLQTNYDLTGHLEDLPSERDQNFLLITPHGEKFVCKIANKVEKLNHLQKQNSVIHHLHHIDPNFCSRLILTSPGEYITSIISTEKEEYYFRLVSYISGTVLAEFIPHSRELLHELGRFVGDLRHRLEDLDLQIDREDFQWSLDRGLETIEQNIFYISDPDKFKLINAILPIFDEEYHYQYQRLDVGLIHGDANDYNLIINQQGLKGSPEISIIDFGDITHSPKIADLAIVIAYTILQKTNPVSIIHEMVKGYNKIIEISDLEMQLLFRLIVLRLCISVSISAYQRKIEPKNQYLTISEKPAWETLIILHQLPVSFMFYLIRSACGKSPHPKSGQVLDWLKNQKASSLLDKMESFSTIDLSFESLDLAGFHNADDLQYYNKVISKDLSQNDFSIGKYLESRLMYIHNSFEKNEENYQSWRSVHIGLDLFTDVNKNVYAVLGGSIAVIANIEEKHNYGPLVIIKHTTDQNIVFYTLYGHLSKLSLLDLSVGQEIKKGEKVGEIGTEMENGQWTPHLHFQIILDLMGLEPGFPGVCNYYEKEIWKSLCPDPNILLKLIKPDSTNQVNDKKDLLLYRREQSISKVLILSYDEPLHIVRGHGQHLFDVNGRRYLDVVNNVPIVGHSNPKVVQALARQAAILNTNTRYLQKPLLSYAESLLSKFPKELDRIFFVNSGSEANELAIRLARTYTGRNDFIVLDQAYHGNTNQTIDISPYKFNGKGGKGKSKNVHVATLPYPFRGKFRGMNTAQEYANEVLTLIEELEMNNQPVAAFIAESLSGVGGQVEYPENYLNDVYSNIRAFGGICIADEVQVGFGRLGENYWGFETQHVIPDIVTLGKPMGNGHPIGAVVTTKKIAASFENGMEFFSSTGGNTVSMAIGLEVLRIIDDEHLQNNALTVGRFLLNEFRKLKELYPIMGDVRGKGLFLGLEFISNLKTLEPAPEICKYIVEQMKAKNILLSYDGPDKNIIKIKPPLIFSLADAKIFITKLTEVLSHTCLELYNRRIKG